MTEECSFTYANVNSSVYDVILCNMGGLSETLFSGANADIITETVSGNSQDLFYGVKETERIEFPLMIKLPMNVDFETVCDIKEWLFGQNIPSKLTINHPDFENYYFMCLLRYDSDYQDISGYRAISFTVHCISAYAYKNPITIDLTSGVQKINIISSELNGVKPILNITKINDDTNESYILNTDRNKNDTQIYIPYKIIDINDNEVVNFKKGDVAYINNQTKVIKKNNVLNTKFLSFGITPDNVWSGFLNLSKGMNEIELSSNISATLTYTPTRRIGGG